MEMSKTKNIILWILQVIIGVFFVMAAVPKLMSAPEVIENFHRWGYPDNFHLLVGGLELLGGIGMLIPKTVTYAASGLAVIMLGAAITHFRAGETTMAITPVVLLVLLSVIAYARCPWTYRIGALPGVEGRHMR
jgi:uncharacterized membrane protein YphA (DoxX/SURF4 family)